ncbi:MULTISPECIES: right-handed parallel beta-helix repeat-containing protein [Achromobacter]|uniref:right-handed parallel beta-helix repeat-containing protein n=1 Tax=Achromobacter sp. ACM04 TaxID=2769312 RepID=UPI001785C02E|nr:right-handed parallel beta-helix repeat-containing protein [Achromobacter sp. ACM04]MBD9423373.1 right-handed parallel beta-helix repeat-containing protein [Achromobacter sp. ACM04]
MTIRTLSLQQLKRSAENSAAMKHHVDDDATVLPEPRTSSSPGNMTGYSVQVQDHGPIADGTLHTLAERYATLSAAQVDYPFVTSLAESIDGAAIQAALDVAFNSGLGQVQCAGGTYVINSSIQMRAGVELVGDGKTVITQPDGLNLLILIDFGFAHGAGLRGCTVNGNRGTNAADYNAVLVHVRGADDATVRDNVLVGSCGYGITCSAARMSVVGNHIEDTFMHAIGVYGFVGQEARHLILQNRIVRPGAGAILLGAADYTIISNNTIYSPIIGGRDARLRVNLTGATVTWISGPKFTNVRIGEVLVIDGGREFRIMARISDTQLTIDPEGSSPALTNELATIGCGDLIGVMSQFCRITDNVLVGGATFGIGCTVGGNAVSTVGNEIVGNTLRGQGKHALVVGWDVGAGGVYDTVLRGNMVYNAGDAGGNSTYDRIPIFLSGQTLGKVGGVLVEGNYIVGPDGDSRCPHWMGTDLKLEYGSVLVGRNHSIRMLNPGIFNDVVAVSLSGWGDAASATEIVSYGHSVRMTINCAGSGFTAGPSFTIHKICDSAEQPAMVKADITTTTGTLGQMWGEQSTASGQWRATYYGTPAAGNTFVITTRA